MTKPILLTLVLSLLFLSRAAIDLNQWELFAEDTQQITISGSRMGRLRASGGINGDFQVQILDSVSQSWINDSDTKAKMLRICPNEEFHVSQTTSRAYVRPRDLSRPWSVVGQFPCNAVECAYNNGDFLWYITGDSISTTPNFISRFDRTELTFVNMTIGASSIAAEKESGRPWLINWQGNIFMRNAGRMWLQKPGTANLITFGSSHNPYIVSKEATPEGFIIKQWNSLTNNWDTIPGVSGISIALDDNDNLYVVTNSKKVYRKKGILSTFCPKCQENCPTCASYEGLCSTTRDQCLTCPPGQFAVDSPLRCEPCPEDCKECSNATTCTACSANLILYPNGTCQAECPLPLIEENVAGKRVCRGPCEQTNSFYYPSDSSCHSTCEVEIVDPSALYVSCSYCPENCVACSSISNCVECASSLFLTPQGTCEESCPPPLVRSGEGTENLRCERPCADSSDVYYPSDGSCRAACSLPIYTCPF